MPPRLALLVQSRREQPGQQITLLGEGLRQAMAVNLPQLRHAAAQRPRDERSAGMCGEGTGYAQQSNVLHTARCNNDRCMPCKAAALLPSYSTEPATFAL